MKNSKPTVSILVLCAAAALAFSGIFLASCELVPPDLIDDPAPHSNPDDPEYVDPNVAQGLVVVLTGAPTTAYSCASSFSITVGGTDVAGYKYSFDDAAYSADTDISTPITIASLTETAHTLKVLGRNSAGVFQDEEDVTVCQWTSDFTAPTAVPNISAFAAEYITGGTQSVTVIDVTGAEHVVVFRYDPDAVYLPVDGTAYAAGAWPTADCEVVYDGSASGFSGFTDDDVPEGLWVYRAYAHDAALNYGTAGTSQDLASYRGVVYVRYDGNDANAGTIDDPLQHISAGVTVASARLSPLPASPAEIHVAGDAAQSETYGPATAGVSVITLNANLHIMGGYKPDDWSIRNAETYRTILQSASTDADYSTVAGVNKNNILLDGLDIRGSEATANVLTHAVRLQACQNAEITNCWITGGAAPLGTTPAGNSYGLYAYDSEINVHDNPSITGGGGYSSFGIYAEGNSTDREITITDNSISGGTRTAGGGSASYGIYLKNVYLSGEISGNTILAADGESTNHPTSCGVSLDTVNYFLLADNHVSGLGGGASSYGIEVNMSTAVTLRNNYVRAGGASTGICISIGATSTIVVRNNTLVGEALGSTTSLCGLRLNLGTPAGNTVLVDNNIFSGSTDGSGTSAFGIYDPVSGLGSFGTGSICNNNFDAWDQAAKDSGANYTAATDLNNNVGCADGNLDEAPTIDHTTGRITSGLAGLTLDTEGLDGESADWSFYTDKDGITRSGNGSTGWSMGCYEYD